MSDSHSMRTLLDMAAENLKAKDAILEKYPDDDGMLNYAGYHLQQAIELMLKHVLEMHGIKYPRTHDIGDLVDLLPDPYTEIAEDIGDNARDITHLESNTRYRKDYFVSSRLVAKVSNLATTLFENILNIEEKERKDALNQDYENHKL